MENSIELGRSFVQPRYWGSRALDYLWFGIGAYLKANPQIKYMYGAVSLSASLSPIAHDLIVDFYSNYFEADFKIVKARNSFEYYYKNGELLSMTANHNYKKDLKVLKNSLKSIDTSIPTLYKQYGDFCEDGGLTFHGFNVDSDFSNCIDGFILVEIAKIKKSKKERYMT